MLVRYGQKAENYPGLTRFACALLWRRRLCQFCGEPVLGLDWRTPAVRPGFACYGKCALARPDPAPRPPLRRAGVLW